MLLIQTGFIRWSARSKELRQTSRRESTKDMSSLHIYSSHETLMQLLAGAKLYSQHSLATGDGY
jgi:hypothetical protein